MLLNESTRSRSSSSSSWPYPCGRVNANGMKLEVSEGCSRFAAISLEVAIYMSCNGYAGAWIKEPCEKLLVLLSKKIHVSKKTTDSRTMDGYELGIAPVTEF